MNLYGTDSQITDHHIGTYVGISKSLRCHQVLQFAPISVSNRYATPIDLQKHLIHDIGLALRRAQRFVSLCAAFCVKSYICCPLQSA